MTQSIVASSCNISSNLGCLLVRNGLWKASHAHGPSSDAYFYGKPGVFTETTFLPLGIEEKFAYTLSSPDPTSKWNILVRLVWFCKL